MTITAPAFNPYAMTNAAGSFNVTSTGWVQGMAVQQPAIRFSLANGTLSVNETLPMFGGVGIYENVPGVTGQPITSLGSTVGRATTLTQTSATGLVGFSVFDQNYSAVNNPQNPVPLVGSYGNVSYYRLGSGAIIPVQCSPNLAAYVGKSVLAQVSWDFTNQQLEPYSSTTIASGSYTSGTGAVSLTTAANHGLLPGDTFELSSVTGSGSYAQLDGEWTATTGTTGTTLNFTATSGLTLTISGGTVSSGGALAVSVLDVNIGSSMVVSYNSGTGQYSWNRSGNAALIKI